MAVKFPRVVLDLIDVSVVEDEFSIIVIDHRTGAHHEFSDPESASSRIRALISERCGDIVKKNDMIRKAEKKDMSAIRAFVSDVSISNLRRERWTTGKSFERVRAPHVKT